MNSMDPCWHPIDAIYGRKSLDALHSAGATEPLSPLLGLGHEAGQSEDPAGLPWPAVSPPVKNILKICYVRQYNWTSS